jgi:DNA topoisomerase II
MQIYSLTNERVERLRAQQSNKENELNMLLKLSAKDIWTRDLDDVSEAWQEVLRNDILAAQNDKSGKKKGATSKFAKVSRKRASDVADGEYKDKKPKVAKTKVNGSPGQSKQSKITSFTSKPTGAKEMHTAAFTSVNKTGSSSFAVPKKTEISKAMPILSIDDDDEFESLIKGIRPDTKPETIDLLSPQTAMKPKKTFTIPATRKPALTAPKSRAASKSKAPKRKVDSDNDDDSFAFMADDKLSAPVDAGERRPARAAATKARAIVLTSDDVFDELDEEDEFEEDED